MGDGPLVPAAQVLGSLWFRALDDGELPVEGALIMKCIDTDGKPRWSLRTTPDFNEMELLGALTVLRRRIYDNACEGWE